MIKVYLAGPDVFLRDPQAQFERLCGWCRDAGAHGVIPGVLPDDDGSTVTLAERIYRINIELLDQADAVIANIAPFRGCEPDSGTIFEIGYAVAKGKPVALYTPVTQTYGEQLRRTLGDPVRDPDSGRDFDPVHQMSIEDFGLKANLMLAIPCPIFETAQRAIAHVVQAASLAQHR